LLDVDSPFSSNSQENFQSTHNRHDKEEERGQRLLDRQKRRKENELRMAMMESDLDHHFFGKMEEVDEDGGKKGKKLKKRKRFIDTDDEEDEEEEEEDEESFENEVQAKCVKVIRKCEEKSIQIKSHINRWKIGQEERKKKCMRGGSEGDEEEVDVDDVKLSIELEDDQISQFVSKETLSQFTNPNLQVFKY